MTVATESAHELRELPLYAQLALAARCARRVVNLFRLEPNHPELAACLKSVGAAIRLRTCDCATQLSTPKPATCRKTQSTGPSKKARAIWKALTSKRFSTKATVQAAWPCYATFSPITAIVRPVRFARSSKSLAGI